MKNFFSTARIVVTALVIALFLCSLPLYAYTEVSKAVEDINHPDAELSLSQAFKARDFSVTLVLIDSQPAILVHARVGKNAWLEDGVAKSALGYAKKTEIRPGLWIQYSASEKKLLVWTAFYGPEHPMKDPFIVE
jgi:hypothetical protein